MNSYLNEYSLNISKVVSSKKKKGFQNCTLKVLLDYVFKSMFYFFLEIILHKGAFEKNHEHFFFKSFFLIKIKLF